MASNAITHKVKFSLLKTIREICLQEGKKYFEQNPEEKGKECNRKLKTEWDYHTVAKCHFIRRSFYTHYNKQGETKWLTGKVTCKNGWVCPYCSARLAAHNVNLIAHTMDWAYKNGYRCLMGTFTFSHGANDRLAVSLKALTGAYTHLTNSGAFKKLKKQMDNFHYIRSIEITYGSNGWHPHGHVLFIVPNDFDFETVNATLSLQWQKSMKKFNLTGSHCRAFRLDDNVHTRDYIAKCKLEKAVSGDWELGSTHTKTGRSTGKDYFELVKEASDGFVDSRRLVGEYIHATKGVAKIRFSKGLKELSGADAIPEQEHTEEEAEHHWLEIDASLDNRITKLNLSGELLDIYDGSQTAEDFKNIIEIKEILDG